MINTVSFPWFSQKLCENVLQNVFQIKSRNFSQISPSRHILATTLAASKARAPKKFLQVGTSLKILPHKETLPPPTPPHKKNGLQKEKQPPPLKRRKEALHMDIKPIVL